MTEDLSPAERYAQFRREQPHPVLADFRELYDFALDDYARHRLLEGLDDIAMTLQHTDDVEAYERSRKPWLPAATV